MSLEMFVSLFAFLGLVASWVVLPSGRRTASNPSEAEPVEGQVS